MAKIQDLFKSQKKGIYGNDNIRIESRGFINPPRGAALLTASPNAIADLIGGQIGGALGGSANRPSDTIFKGPEWYRKPISLFKTQQSLKNAVEKDTDYFIKQDPSPASVFASLNQGASSLAGVATNLAINAVTKGGLKELSEKLKKKKPQKYNNKNKFSDTIKVTEEWDTDTINYLTKIEADKLTEFISTTTGKNIVPILFKKFGSSTSIPFMCTLSSLSEDVQSEWNNFKYIGSPFKIHRYQGVERSLKFNLKLYYFTPEQKENMIKKIHFLKSLAFPYEEISEMTYAGSQKSQYAFSPNLVFLTIGDMYKDVFGFIESLSFQVEDNVTWPTLGVPDIDNYMYPSVVNVNISMKMIENHKVTSNGGITKYRYDFDGRQMLELEEKKEEQKKLIEKLNQENYGHGVGQMGDKL